MPKPVFVRLRRGFFAPDGGFWPAGVHEFPANFDTKKLPKTAKILKDEEEVADAKKADEEGTLPDGAKPLAQETKKTLSEIGKSS